MQSHQITPLFSVEGQRMQALHEMKNYPLKMAVIIEQEQDRTGRIIYTYELIKPHPYKVGQEWSAPVGWKATVRAVIFPWEAQAESTIKTIIIEQIIYEEN